MGTISPPPTPHDKQGGVNWLTVSVVGLLVVLGLMGVGAYLKTQKKSDAQSTLESYLKACAASDEKTAHLYSFAYVPVVYTFKILRDDGGESERGQTEDVRAVVKDYFDAMEGRKTLGSMQSESYQQDRRQFIAAHPVFCSVLFTVAGLKVFPPQAFEKPGPFLVETKRFIVDLDYQKLIPSAGGASLDGKRETARQTYTLARVSIGDDSLTPERGRTWFIAFSGDVGKPF